MASEGLDAEEEWDPEFVDKLVQAEELALSAQPSRHRPPPPPPPRPPPPAVEISYSPPRELSQRTHQTIHTACISDSHDSFAPHSAGSAMESAIQKELNRALKQLRHLEKECSELRKENKNLEQLNLLNSRIEAKDADVNLTKNKEIPLDPGIPATRHNVKPSNKQLESCTKSCVAGRDNTNEVSTSALKETYCPSAPSKKLFALWNSNDQKQGRVLVAKLYKTCEMDFNVLFGHLDSPKDGSDMASSDEVGPFEPFEYTKVLHLQSIFTKISNDVLGLEALLEALVDLCNLKNDFIVHWSLRVLHKILGDFSSMETEYGERENVTVEESISGNVDFDTNRCGTEKESLSIANVAEMLKQGQVPSAVNFSTSKIPDFSGFANHSFAAYVSGAYQVSLFGHMCLISTKRDNERVRCEALSIMNLILMRHNAYLERDKFAGELVFQSLSLLLRKKAGFSVQDQAVHALHLLYNCPKVVARISSFLKEVGELTFSNDINANSFPTFQQLNEIFIGLADCVAYHGSATIEEMKLRRNAICFLAFLGSSGKPGFEILINHRLPEGSNFLAIILQSILSDLDLQASKPASRSVVLEQSLLIREALILLNRLVSHPQYSVPALNALTATRDAASITVEVANRLTQKTKVVGQDYYDTTKQTRESVIFDLARGFKRRVFTFLGDNIS